MAKPFHSYDVGPDGKVTDPSEPGGKPAPGDDIQDQYNGLGGGEIGIGNPGRGGKDYYWGKDKRASG